MITPNHHVQAYSAFPRVTSLKPFEQVCPTTRQEYAPDWAQHEPAYKPLVAGHCFLGMSSKVDPPVRGSSLL